MALMRNKDNTIKKDMNGNPISFVSEAQANARQRYDQRRAEKRAREQKRDEEASHRSPLVQLGRLDERLGTGIGATKERAKIQNLIEGKKKKK